MKISAYSAAFLIGAASAYGVSEEDLAKFNEGFDKKIGPNAERVAEAEKVIKTITLKAKPAQKRKVLIYGISWGPHRTSIPTAMDILAKAGEVSGAYKAVVSLDLANFEADKLKQFDAVCFPNTTGNVFVRPLIRDEFKKLSKEEQAKENENANRLAENLASFVKNGGGFIGMHAATDCNKNLPAYIDMIGGAFYGHPWNASSKVTITVDEPDHALCEGIFPGQEFTYSDEIYEFKEFSKEKCRVLMSLNVEKSDKPAKKMKTDYIPITWVKQYGNGRVFYCSLGHRSDTWAEKSFLAHILAGIQYAVGDLEAKDDF